MRILLIATLCNYIHLHLISSLTQIKIGRVPKYSQTYTYDTTVSKVNNEFFYVRSNETESQSW